MKLRQTTATSVLTILGLAITSMGSAQSSNDLTNLLFNGDFTEISYQNLPEDWEFSHPNYLQRNEAVIEVLSEKDFNYLRVVKGATATIQMGTQIINIPEGATKLRLSIRMRGEDIMPGIKDWQLPGLTVTFIRPDGSTQTGHMGDFLLLPIGDSKWKQYQSTTFIRDEARQAHISLQGIGWTGTADFAEVVVESLK